MAGRDDAGGSKASRSASVHISGSAHSFRQSGEDAGGSKASRDMVNQGVGVSGGHTLGGGKGDGDAGGPKGKGG
jgi:hypothetical protein